MLAISFARLSTSLTFRSIGHQTLRQPLISGSRRSLASNTAPPASSKKVFGYTLVGLVTAGGLYEYYKYKRTEKFAEGVKNQISNSSSNKDYSLTETPPSYNPARKIRNHNDKSGLKITLYQYQTCPFCCKARAFLDYYGFSYDVIEVNSVMRTQVKWSKYKKVPFIVVELESGELLQIPDSTLIISILGTLIKNNFRGNELLKVLNWYPKITYNTTDGKKTTEVQNKFFLMYTGNELTPEDGKQIVEERKWRMWVDDVYVHLLSPNVYRTLNESFEAFKWFEKAGDWENHFSAWERFVVIYLGSLAMWIIGKRLKKRHNLTSDVRQSFYVETNRWLKTLQEKKTPFMGGAEPNLADLSLFGALSAIEGCSSFSDLVKNTKILPWYEAMKEQCRTHEGQKYLTS